MVCCEILGFLHRSLMAIGCFFNCFRIRDSHQRSRRQIIADSTSSGAELPIASRHGSALSSLLLSEVAIEAKDDSPRKDLENQILVSPLPEFDIKELKDEAKYLKACGTIPETPAEIRKALERMIDLTAHSGDIEDSEFHSWLPRISAQKLKLDKEPGRTPTPIKLCDELFVGSGSSVNAPDSCVNYEQDAGMICTSSLEGIEVGLTGADVKASAELTSNSTTSLASPTPLAENVQYRSKTVRFDCEIDAPLFIPMNSSSQIYSRSPELSEPAAGCRLLNPSPDPTPLKLTDDMQTPGTMCPSYLASTEKPKNAQIRSQYVHSFLKPVEDLSQWKVLKEGASSSSKFSGSLGESQEVGDMNIPKTEVGVVDASVEKELKLEASLSPWLQLPATGKDGIDENIGTLSSKAQLGRIFVDRPIIGMVAAHWSEDEASHISPRWWDGNGIPNSTSKYKEDQKVSWHATPFEERLEKALSEETQISQRKLGCGTRSVEFDDNEESDTANSQLPSATNFKSVLSC